MAIVYPPIALWGSHRRSRSILALLALALAVIMPMASLNSGSAADGLSALGLPELNVVVYDDHFDAPSSVIAGRTLITVENAGSESRHSFLARLPEAVTIGELLAGGSDDGPPSWLFESEFAGYPGETGPGETYSAVVDLTPGLYALIDDFAAVILVTPADDTGTTPPDPVSTSTVSLFEFGFQVAVPFTSGTQVVKIVNAGRAPHELELLRLPSGTTKDEFGAALAADEGTAPAEGDLRLDDLAPAGGLSWLTQGSTAWAEVTLEPGTYALVCWVFDPELGMTHAMEGMYDVVTVS